MAAGRDGGGSGTGAITRVSVPKSPVAPDFHVSTNSGQLTSVYRPPSPAGNSSVSARIPQAAKCQRGVSLSRNMTLTASSSAAAPEAVNVCSKKDQISVMRLHLHLVQQLPQLVPLLGGDGLFPQERGHQIPGGPLIDLL